jgi:hypothetical protein
MKALKKGKIIERRMEEIMSVGAMCYSLPSECPPMAHVL